MASLHRLQLNSTVVKLGAEGILFISAIKTEYCKIGQFFDFRFDRVLVLVGTMAKPFGEMEFKGSIRSGTKQGNEGYPLAPFLGQTVC